jgi:hypothetical protein
MADLAGSSMTKRTLASMPGRKYDSLYYNKDTSKVEFIENVCTTGKYLVNLNSPTYGGTSSITFPNLNFIGKCFLHIELPALDLDTYPNAVLCQGWGMALINSIELLIGNSNIASQRIDRTAMFHSLYSQKQTADDLMYDLNEAGFYVDGSPAVSTFVPSFTYDGKYCADIILDLPWSNYCQAESDKLYFDTSMLTAPITLNITFNGLSSIWGGTYTPPSSSFVAQLFYRQQELTNRNESLRNSLFSSPGSAISYPSVYRQTFPVAFSSPASESDYVQVNLMSFLNADLLSITLAAHLNDDLITTTANHPVNPFAPLEIYDVQLLFGGDVVYNIPKKSYKLINQESNVGAVYLTNTYSRYVGGELLRGIKQTHILQIDMSRLRQMCNTTSFFNTVRLAKQVLQLQFKMKSTNYWQNGQDLYSEAIAPGTACTLACTYFYPMVTEVNSTGSVNIFYN